MQITQCTTHNRRAVNLPVSKESCLGELRKGRFYAHGKVGASRLVIRDDGVQTLMNVMNATRPTSRLLVHLQRYHTIPTPK